MPGGTLDRKMVALYFIFWSCIVIRCKTLYQKSCDAGMLEVVAMEYADTVTLVAPPFSSLAKRVVKTRSLMQAQSPFNCIRFKQTGVLFFLMMLVWSLVL